MNTQNQHFHAILIQKYTVRYSWVPINHRNLNNKYIFRAQWQSLNYVQQLIHHYFLKAPARVVYQYMTEPLLAYKDPLIHHLQSQLLMTKKFVPESNRWFRVNNHRNYMKE